MTLREGHQGFSQGARQTDHARRWSVPPDGPPDNPSICSPGFDSPRVQETSLASLEGMVNRSRAAAVLSIGALLLAIAPGLCSAASAVAVKKRPATSPKAARGMPERDRGAAGQARRWMAKMTLRDRVAQLVMTACYGDSPNIRSREFREFRSQVVDLKIGGLIVLNRVRDGVFSARSRTRRRRFSIACNGWRRRR